MSSTVDNNRSVVNEANKRKRSKKRAHDPKDHKQNYLYNQTSCLNRRDLKDINIEQMPKEYTNKYAFDRSNSCDISSEINNTRFERQQDIDTRAFTYGNHNLEMEEYLRNNRLKLNERTSSNSRRITSYDKPNESRGKEQHNSNAFQEYLANKDYRKVPLQTERGLFSHNERISSRKQFFRNVRESLMNESLDCSKLV